MRSKQLVSAYLETVRNSKAAAKAIFGPAQESTAATEILYHCSPLVVVEKDRNGIVLACNLSAGNLFGRTVAEAAGKHISELAPKDWRRYSDLERRIFAAGQVQQYREHYSSPDGRWHSLVVRSVPLKDRIVHIAIDFTELLACMGGKQ